MLAALQVVVAVIAQNAGTEPTDFLVPFGVIASSGFVEVQAVAADAGPVTMHPGDVTVELPHTFATFEAAYPGGASYVIVPAVHHPDDAALGEWLREQRRRGATIMSICDGAQVLAHAGLLEGKAATAHWHALEDLRKEFPATNWRNDRRYVLDGDIITTAGVSASVPGTLALLERIGGRERTQRYAATLGIAGWSEQHDGAAFRLTGAAMRTIAANKLAFWRRERVALAVPDGADEAALALILDAYSRTYRSDVVLATRTVRTRHGLTLHSPSGTARRTLAPELLQAPLGATLDLTLGQLERDYGAATADWVALQLEYARSR